MIALLREALAARLAPFIAMASLLVLIALAAWALRLDNLRADWAERHATLAQQAGVVLAALRQASDNPELQWKEAAGQALALGESNRLLRVSISEQNARVNDMAREAVRLKAEAAELKRIADRAKAERRAALERLSDLSITPGTREDCLTLLREAEEALDLVYEAGL